VDRALVERARDGDKVAFARLVDEAGDRLYSVAFHILRDSEAADDAAQQALIVIWQQLPRLRDPDRFDAWACRILVRSAYAQARRERRWHPTVVRFPQPEVGVDDAAGRLADRDRLERGFRRLSPEQRAVVSLKHYACLGDDEIAQVLDVPVGTVRSRLFYAMRALRAAIDADERPAVMDLA
jgi:RNA polymerase sigma-70 factor (ECF subfamily)